jgi:tetratricopeptide (TPR) repeat protein
MSNGTTYKIKLESGRVLGPLDLDRVRLLILKNHILGKELARVYPSGDWGKIGSIPELGQLLILRAEGKLSKDVPIASDTAATRILPNTHFEDALPTQVVKPVYESPVTAQIQPPTPENETHIDVGGVEHHEETEVESSKHFEPQAEDPVENQSEHDSHQDEQSYKATGINELLIRKSPRAQAEPRGEEDGEDETLAKKFPAIKADLDMFDSSQEIENNEPFRTVGIAHEETVMLDMGNKKKKKSPIPGTLKEKIKAIAAAVALGIAGYQVFLEEPAVPQFAKIEVVRPALPTFRQKPDPGASQKKYAEAMRFYVQDNVLSYRFAASKLQEAAALDINNVKALAMLASTYLNLIDSSNKDENYFSVISKLIDMTRAKSMDLSETVIAEVEFFVTVNKAEAAQNRIIEYTKIHPNFGSEMFYYLALAFYARGDYQSSSRYAQQISDNRVFSPKVFYLRGLSAEKLGDFESALLEYGKALKMNKNHAKSRLRVAYILNERGKINEAKEHLDFIVNNSRLLSAKDLGLAYYLHSVLSEQKKDYEIALGDAERAVQLDKDNHSYLLQLYSMRAKGGESLLKLRKEAKMYYFLEEGEKQLKEGKAQEALNQFLQARQSNNDSPIPLVKIGDMFMNLHDLGNARVNYKMAADRARTNIDIWSKYINVLIQSYEWDEAELAMEKFRRLPVSQSAIDKAAGDMYAKQGQFQQAQLFYKKAMARTSIDPAVYISYAKSLMSTQNYKEAPFFFALAQRYDPLNVETIIGTAKCIANTDSVDRAITMLEDELQKGYSNRAELLGAIAEFQIQKGDWDQAQKTIDQAMSANPDYAYAWKLQAQVYMNREGHDRGALDKALSAYQSYSDRNSSDPSGYLERYRIFMKKLQFDQAGEELGKIFGIYPKYPNLHYYKGILDDNMGNHKLAIEEYQLELKNNPSNIESMLELGKEYLETGNYPEALNLFNKAMQVAPNMGEPKHLSGYANYLLKNYMGAIALYNAAISKDPGNPLIYKRLGLAQRDVGDYQGAAASFGRYIQMEPDAPDRAEFQRYAK